MQQKTVSWSEHMNDNPYAEPVLTDLDIENRSRSPNTLLMIAFGLTVAVILLALFLPALRWSPSAALRTHCLNNMKNIATALQHYHIQHGSLPPAYTVDANGRPLHSWRTLILPYVDQQQLYDSIDLSKPWNDPVNAAAGEAIIHVYQCHSADISPNHTSYQGIVGENSCLHPTRFRRFSEVTDGASQTLMLIEVSPDDAVPWMSPDDFGVRFLLTLGADTRLTHEGGTVAAMADGSVQFMGRGISESNRQALMTIDGGETFSDW